ncbi:recombinase family protein [Arcticibacter eurypsychrophilus]|uniref:recombinase family protein n=1 Tax=Arcticibacter eurypsychrophilus TaxID=1434752 RepID=UPI000A72D518|nr:recombinase family protein [Arcticibacter eurypsychrophilus]
MKTADLYIRVSTDEQADKGYSQRDQDERIRTYCEKKNIQSRKVVFEDYSAKTFNRPEWTELFADWKKNKGKQTDYVIFTKWDRFSRNTADAYTMIRTLKTLDIEPIAIDQPLDLSVPESKMILTVYLSTPEVENDRRALNVFYGLRRARKEGRWTGMALPGYINRTRENGTKYIAIHKPEASHMKWAFEMIAKNQYAIEHIWAMAKERGLRCTRTCFWTAIRNPCYCGKIVIPAFKEEERFLTNGLHEPLISVHLFYEVQDVLDNKRRKIGLKAVQTDNLPLRGFLICPSCNRQLTGSASKGRNSYHYYYHCKYPCKIRFNAREGK